MNSVNSVGLDDLLDHQLARSGTTNSDLETRLDFELPRTMRVASENGNSAFWKVPCDPENCPTGGEIRKVRKMPPVALSIIEHHGTGDLQRKRITVIPSKTRRKKRVVHIPMQPDLLAYLESAAVRDDSPAAPVFPALAKLKTDARKGLSTGFISIMAAAAVDRGKPSRVIEEGQKRDAGRIVWERGFHSLRHTFTSWLRNAGVSEEDRMALTGHSTRESHQVYSHADEVAGRKAIKKLPRLKKSQP